MNLNNTFIYFSSPFPGWERLKEPRITDLPCPRCWSDGEATYLQEVRDTGVARCPVCLFEQAIDDGNQVLAGDEHDEPR